MSGHELYGSKHFSAAGLLGFPPPFCNRRMLGGRELDVEAMNLVGESIGQATSKSAEKLPFHAGFFRANDGAIDDAVVVCPLHPTWR